MVGATPGDWHVSDTERLMTDNADGIGRRDLLIGGAVALAAGSAGVAATKPIPIIDTHIHLFDPARPQGAPYRGPRNSPTYEKGALPAGYAALVRRFNVVGAIKVEASPWIEDNLWVLEAAATNPIMVGVVGNIPLTSSDYPAMVTRLAKNPLLRGLRYGNLWGYDLAARSREAGFRDSLKLMADLDLTLDTANQRIDLLEAVVRVADAVPNLRVVIDHLPHFDPKPGEQAAYAAVLRELSQRPSTYVKLSEIIHPVDGRTAKTVDAYRDRLRLLADTFGPDRVLFGSDWPNILQDATLEEVFAVAHAFYADRPRVEQEKYFWRNSLKAYKWQARSAAQRQLALG